MNNILTTISLSVSVLGYLFSNSVSIGICTQAEYTCRNLFNNIGDPLFYGMGAFAIVFGALALYPRAQLAWNRFAIWYLPLGVAFFLFSRDPGSGDFFSPYPEQIYQWVGGLFVVISFAIIGFSAIWEKSGKTLTQKGSLIPHLIPKIIWIIYIVWLLSSIASWLY